MWRQRFAILCLILVLFALSGRAAQGFVPEKRAEPDFASAETVNIAGMAVGAGFGMRGIGGNERHNLANGQLQIGRSLLGVVGERSWWQGRWMALGELGGAHQIDPEAGSLVSLTPLIRFQFLPQGSLAPFLEAGIGAVWTDIGYPDLSNGLQFNSMGGGGAHWFFRETTALTGGYRLIHYSNGGRSSPNSGINISAVSLGLTHFY